jgi:hypothetical protein
LRNRKIQDLVLKTLIRVDWAEKVWVEEVLSLGMVAVAHQIQISVAAQVFQTLILAAVAAQVSQTLILAAVAQVSQTLTLAVAQAAA